MADMHHLITVDGADADAAYTALTTQDGITGWWTSRAQVSGKAIGDRLTMSFPDASYTWDVRVARTEPTARVEWEFTGGPPWVQDTRIAWEVEAGDSGVVVRFDHTGFHAADDKFRIITVGWAQVLLCLRSYLESGIRKPFFDF
jgi:uncharacterized protein YndB with AHSA1/START domain